MSDYNYLICPCTGEVPFLVSSIEECINYVITEEYFAVELSSMSFVSETGEITSAVEEVAQ